MNYTHFNYNANFSDFFLRNPIFTDADDDGGYHRRQGVGNAAAVEWIYTSPWTVALWIATVAGSGCYIIRHHRRLNLPALLLHASFAVILSGAG